MIFYKMETEKMSLLPDLLGHLRGLLGVGLDPVVDSFEDVHFGGTERVPKVRKNDFEFKRIWYMLRICFVSLYLEMMSLIPCGDKLRNDECRITSVACLSMKELHDCSRA